MTPRESSEYREPLHVARGDTQEGNDVHLRWVGVTAQVTARQLAEPALHVPRSPIHET